MSKVSKYRVGKLSKWHDLIRGMFKAGCGGSTIRYVIEDRGGKVSRWAVYLYIEEWNKRGFPAAAELGWGMFQVTELAPKLDISNKDRNKRESVNARKARLKGKVNELKVPESRGELLPVRAGLAPEVSSKPEVRANEEVVKQEKWYEKSYEEDPLGSKWRGYGSEKNWWELLSGVKGTEKLLRELWEMSLVGKRINYDELSWEALGWFDIFGAVRWGSFNVEPKFEGLDERQHKFEMRMLRGMYLELLKKIEVKRKLVEGEVRFYIDGGVLEKVELERQDYLRMSEGWRAKKESEGWVLPLVEMQGEGLEIRSERFKGMADEDDNEESEGEVWEKWRGWSMEEWVQKVRSKLG